MTDHDFSPRANRAGEIAWRAWGEGAFSEAKAANKPVLLAISAVWCHWCHVMDETSYSDSTVIGTINERFVPIRVDNDQRPDVNRRYNMGGWPTTAFLTPDGDIIHGGTYIPPETMRETLVQVADVWRDRRDVLTQRMEEIRQREREARAQKPGALSWEIVDRVGALVRSQYDPEFGGFGREPKFPQPKLLRFLIAEYRRTGDDVVAAMLRKTLDAMAAGGMYDPVEGGFFRYATTRQWAVPHFEKMLEDNAELLAIYAEAARLFPEGAYGRVARDVIRWMDAVLWREDAQAFSGSQDADERYYELDAAGRAQHAAPYVDRTLYTSWNALAASGYFAAAAALDEPRFAERARAVLRTIATRLTVDGHVMRFDRGNGPLVSDLLGDLAANLAATLDAYETGDDPAALDEAARVAGHMLATLEDPEAGGLWDMPERDEPGRLGQRDKPIEDGAAAADALSRLAALTEDGRWRVAAQRALSGFAQEYERWGQFAAAYATAVGRVLSEPRTVVVVGPADDDLARRLWSTARLTSSGSLHRLLPERDAERLAASGYPSERTAAYVCIGTACSAPIHDTADLATELVRAERQSLLR